MQNTSIDYILGSDSITVILDGSPFTINKQAHTFDLVLKAVKQNNKEALRNAINIKQGIMNGLSKNNQNIRIEDNQIFYQDREVSGLVASRIFEIIRLGLDVQPMVKFLDNLMLNPSKRAVDELFGFLEVCSLPITPDGYFLAYKRVRSDYKDCHSGTMDNSIGQVLEMPRNLVDEDKSRTCSAGLHFCSYDYLKHFSGERVVVLKINPSDVVAIPEDYQNSKGRTCKYEVVDELPLSKDMLPSNKIKDGYCDDYSDDNYNNYLDESDDSSESLSSLQQEVKTNGKLTAEQVRWIRNLLKYDPILTEIASAYNVSPRTIARIRDGESYKYVV